VTFSSFSGSTITEVNSSGTPLATVTYTPGWAEDITYIGGTLWVSDSGGTMTHINLSGTVLGSFAGTFGEGISTDGTFLYTTDGFNSGTGVITQRTLAGVPTGLTISTGFGANLSLGYDAANHAFWLGALDTVGEYSFTGTKIGGFSTPDANHYHDGVAVGSFATSAVPEPSSFMLMGSGAAAFLWLARRRRGL
jgi:hypothetical protein